jgi:hypothetical protein
MSGAVVWRIGGLLNLIQTTFVGILRVLSVPIVLMLSIASGYTTYYGLSFFITPWIGLVITVAVQSIVVICSLELAGMHWRANPGRYFSVLLSLLVALTVSVTFSYFKFYEVSQRDSIVIERQAGLAGDVGRYLEKVVQLKSQITASQQQRIAAASEDTNKAYMGTYPGMKGSDIGKGRMWSYYNEILKTEQDKLAKLETQTRELDQQMIDTRAALRVVSSRMEDPTAHEHLLQSFHYLQTEADLLAAGYGLPPIEAPRLGSHTEFTRSITPSFDMWRNISWFALACAAMVDFFTLILSYRLEMTAPGPLTEAEKDLVFQGLRQFSQFRINANDELEFIIERSELERARRVSDWQRMFAVAYLLNRGYLRKMSARSVEFAPTLYPIVAERMKVAERNGATPAIDDPLTLAMRSKLHG